MKEIVIYTQRVEIVESYQERRDCADQSIPRFLETCGYIPVPVPNVVQTGKDDIMYKSCWNYADRRELAGSLWRDGTRKR